MSTIDKPVPSILDSSFPDTALAALKEAVAEVVEEHARLGIAIPVWRDGKIVDVSHEEAQKRTLKRH